MSDSIALAEMLCTRLCHDLTGPLGAVNNGAEFLKEEEDGPVPPEALDLILSSSQEAVYRIQFYRQAYGRAGEGMVTLDTHHDIVTDFFSATKITCEWPQSGSEQGRVSVSRDKARLLLNLLIVAMSGLLKGGTISLNVAQGGAQMQVSAQGDLMKYDEQLQGLLDGSVPVVAKDPKTVHYVFVRELAEQAGCALSAQYDEATGVVLSVADLHANAPS